MGDPIFVDLGAADMPVYTAMHGQGQWTPEQIAESLRAFVLSISSLNSITDGRTNPKLLSLNPISAQETRNVLNRIRMVNTLASYSFWEMLLDTGK